MTNGARLRPAILGLLALCAGGLLLENGARAGDGPSAPPLPTTWVYDVRVVRVDATAPATVEAAPPWQPPGATGATTKAAWADLLAGLKARGRTTILLDQRVTALHQEKTELKQDWRRVALTLRTRQDGLQGKTELSDASYVETGTRGELTPSFDGLRYQFEVRWEEAPPTEAGAPLGSVSWRGSHSSLPSGETMVLSYRQQLATGKDGGAPGLELYVLVTGWPVPAK